MMYDIAAIVKRLATQDNACTAHPIFVVQQRERIYGIDAQWTDDIAWIDDEGEVDPSDPDWTKAEEHYQETGEELWEWTRTGYVDRWVFVQPFFTRAAAEAYIEANGHRLTDPRVYVDSAYRNREWQAIVSFLPVAQRCIDAGRAVQRYFVPGAIKGWDVRVARRLLKWLSEALGEQTEGLACIGVRPCACAQCGLLGELAAVICHVRDELRPVAEAQERQEGEPATGSKRLERLRHCYTELGVIAGHLMIESEAGDAL